MTTPPDSPPGTVPEQAGERRKPRRILLRPIRPVTLSNRITASPLRCASPAAASLPQARLRRSGLDDFGLGAPRFPVVTFDAIWSAIPSISYQKDVGQLANG